MAEKGNPYKDEKGHYTSKENDGGACRHKLGDSDFDKNMKLKNGQSWSEYFDNAEKLNNAIVGNNDLSDDEINSILSGKGTSKKDIEKMSYQDQMENIGEVQKRHKELMTQRNELKQKEKEIQAKFDEFWQEFDKGNRTMTNDEVEKLNNEHHKVLNDIYDIEDRIMKLEVPGTIDKDYDPYKEKETAQNDKDNYTKLDDVKINENQKQDQNNFDKGVEKTLGKDFNESKPKDNEKLTSEIQKLKNRYYGDEYIKKEMLDAGYDAQDIDNILPTLRRETPAQTLKKELKSKGFNTKGISVKYSSFSGGDAVDVRVDDPSIDLDQVEKIARGYESIDRDEYTGEILSGGNSYVSAKYSDKAIQQMVDEKKPEAEKLFKKMDEQLAQNKNTIELPKGYSLFSNDGKLYVYHPFDKDYKGYQSAIEISDTDDLAKTLYLIEKHGRYSTRGYY